MSEVEDLEKKLIAAKLVLKGQPIKTKEDDEEVDLRKCYIHTDGIMKLFDYLSDKQMPLDDIDSDKIADRYVIPIILPDGGKIIVEVQNTQNDIKTEMISFDDGNSGILLIKEEIENKITEICGNTIDLNNNKFAFFPEDLSQLAKKISDGTLIPQNSRDVARSLALPGTEKDENEKDIIDKKTILDDENLEESQGNKDKKEETSEIPEGIVSSKKQQGDEAKEISDSEELINSKRLIQIVVVDNPNSVKEKASEETGIREEGGKVTLLRFSAPGINIKDTVILVQDGRILARERANDEAFTTLMTDISGKKVEELKDKESKVVYTDKDGNTTVCDMVRKPRDLAVDDKRKIEEKLREIDKKQEAIRLSDMAPDEKMKAYNALNIQRVDIIIKSGLAIPLIEKQMENDSKELEEDDKNKSEKKEGGRTFGDMYAGGRTIGNPHYADPNG